MSKVLVTGGAGYVGSVLVRDLIQRGYSVKIFDKLYFGDEHFGDLKKRLEIVQGDLSDFDKHKEEVLKDVQAVIHLAGFSNDPMADYNPKINMKINADGTRILAEACVEKGISRFIFASSASVYDKGLRSSTEMQNENSKVDPKSAYSLSKYMGEQYLIEILNENSDFCPVILRKGTIFGYSPRMRFDLVVNTFVKDGILRGRINVFCGGTQWRPLVDINDVSRAYIVFLEAEPKKIRGEIFNVVQGNYQVWDIAHRVKSTLVKGGLCQNVDVNIDYDDTRIDRSYMISGEKLERRLGFRYSRSIEDAVLDIGERIVSKRISNPEDPLYYNIRWMEKLLWWEKTLNRIGYVNF